MSNVANFQLAYNAMIGLSNTAFQRSKQKEWVDVGLSSEWLNRSEAYDASAEILCTACLKSGMMIITTTSERQLYSEAERIEEMNSDSSIKMTCHAS